jgi:hypothetical protein
LRSFGHRFRTHQGRKLPAVEVRGMNNQEISLKSRNVLEFFYITAIQH